MTFVLLGLYCLVPRRCVHFVDKSQNTIHSIIPCAPWSTSELYALMMLEEEAEDSRIFVHTKPLYLLTAESVTLRRSKLSL